MPLVEAGGEQDRTAVAALLASQGLPLAGFGDAGELLVARQDGSVVGCAAIEVYADGGLLRSVAVAPSCRGTGLGRALVEAAVLRATALRLPALILLTTTAEHFFPRLGFEVIARAAAPAGVSQSVEFTSACPSTAVVMRKMLTLV